MSAMVVMMIRDFRLGAATRVLSFLLAMILIATPLAPVAAAPKIIPATGTPIAVDMGKGTIIRLDKASTSVFVADPEIADVQLKSPTMIYLMGKSAGETTVYALDNDDTVLLNSRVEVRQDIGRLQREIQLMDPNSRVKVRAVEDSIVLEGSIANAAEGDDIRKIAARYVSADAKLVNKLILDAPNQIDLQVRVAEVQRSVLKQFGINWFNVQQSTLASFGFISGTNPLGALSGGATRIVPPLAGSSLAGANTSGIAGFNAPSATLLGGATNNNFFASYHQGDFLINALVDALAQNGMLTVLAEPNLVTVSGQKASFLAGGEFPVPVPESGNNSFAIGIEWKQFGVSLNFTPTILASGRIALHVAPEVSELAPQQGVQIQGVTIPGITTRRADTTVELGSGQTFAIAGLLQNQTQQQLQAYPWIGDIPVIGSLFRSTAFQRGETELVILITPYLVHPVSSATALQSGLDGFRAPNDHDRVLTGAVNSAIPVTPLPAQPTATSRPPVAAFAAPPAVSGRPQSRALAPGFELD
jgi:pilus assembly protein CpaC